jgi:hypothetical protein
MLAGLRRAICLLAGHAASVDEGLERALLDAHEPADLHERDLPPKDLVADVAHEHVERFGGSAPNLGRPSSTHRGEVLKHLVG